MRKAIVQVPPLLDCSHRLKSVPVPATAPCDPEAARDALAAAVSLVLRLLGREPDPAKSREHVLLSVLAERRLAAGQPPELGALLQDILEPPIDRIGALSVNAFIKKTERRALAAALNNLLASPTFASWRQGATMKQARAFGARLEQARYFAGVPAVVGRARER